MQIQLLLSFLFACQNVAFGGIPRSSVTSWIENHKNLFSSVQDLGETQIYNNYSLDALGVKISEYAPVTVTSNIEDFTDNERKVLDLIIEAAKYMDPIFNRQVYRWYNRVRENLERWISVIQLYFSILYF